MKDLRKAFFRQILDRRDALERAKNNPPIIEEVVPPERLWNYLDYVGSFLIENEVITMNDRDLAVGMIEDYEERLKSIYPGV